MGEDLILKWGHKKINIGRAHNYEINGKLPTQDEIDRLWDDILEDLKLDINKYAGYTPDSLEELDEITRRLTQHVDETWEEILKLARLTLVLQLVDEGIKHEKG